LFDRSGPALDQARRRFDRLGLTARYESGDMLGPLDRWEGRFDVAISLGVVEHFRRYRRTAAIRAHYEVLRPGGMAIISVPNAWCLPYRLWKFYLERRGWWPYGMERPYSPGELARRARHAGFTRTETICLNFLESVGNHWVKRLSGQAPQWTDRPSRFDATMGFILLMFGQRPAATETPKD
jgi:2-polyprenyl-3-methyl-5-hydroxy-6-metoxy-1,4-benzoquinol methylase